MRHFDVIEGNPGSKAQGVRGAAPRENFMDKHTRGLQERTCLRNAMQMRASGMGEVKSKSEISSLKFHDREIS